MKQVFSFDLTFNIDPPEGMNKDEAERWINSAVESGRELSVELVAWLQKQPLIQSCQCTEFSEKEPKADD